MNSDEKRREEIEGRIAEMRYAVAHLSDPGDPLGRYLLREIDGLIEEARTAAGAWSRMLTDLEDLRGHSALQSRDEDDSPAE